MDWSARVILAYCTDDRGGRSYCIGTHPQGYSSRRSADRCTLDEVVAVKKVNVHRSRTQGRVRLRRMAITFDLQMTRSTAKMEGQEHGCGCSRKGDDLRFKHTIKHRTLPQS
jgi:hypothetical protein